MPVHPYAFALWLLLSSMAALGHDELPLAMKQVAPGVYVHRGVHEEVQRGNHGAIANIGFVVGAKCVAVIDSGGSLPVGRALRREVARVTPLPVCYVINTHVHPDHIFGNAAFRADQPVYAGHDKLARAMATRGQIYLRVLERQLGSDAAGAELIAPTLTVKAGERHEIDLGNRVLELRAWPTAHTDNDLTVLDRSTGTLWTGDLLFSGHIPAVDGSARGWLALGEALRALRPVRVVPGHGEAAGEWTDLLASQERYLETVVNETRAQIKAGRTLRQAVDSVGESERGRWELFDAFHRRNVTAVYAELEWED